MDEHVNPDNISSEEISLLRELLSVLVREENLLLKGQKEERKALSKKRSAINRKIRCLKNHPQQQLNFFDESDHSYMRTIYEALEKEIVLQKKRNIALLKYGGFDTLKKNPAVAPKTNKPRLLTLDSDLYHEL